MDPNTGRGSDVASLLGDPDNRQWCDETVPFPCPAVNYPTISTSRGHVSRYLPSTIQPYEAASIDVGARFCVSFEIPKLCSSQLGFFKKSGPMSAA